MGDQHICLNAQIGLVEALDNAYNRPGAVGPVHVEGHLVHG